MDRNEVKKLLQYIDIYDKSQFSIIVQDLKHNFCQNMRIARKLSNISPESAAQHLGIEPQTLRRLEAENDRDEFSSQVLLLAITYYDLQPNFYFEDWRKNELLLKNKK